MSSHGTNGKHFEIVEVVDGDAAPEGHGNLIGFDLSQGYHNSLLWWGLTPPSPTSKMAKPIIEFHDLISRFYAPQLNEHGLFQTPEIASRCLCSMIALQDLCPNYFEGGSLEVFRVVGVYV